MTEVNIEAGERVDRANALEVSFKEVYGYRWALESSLQTKYKRK